ncbi:unnamed protein product [Eruca vesicaria subsp. sativa]|uniref:Uncharacterized protein n=1 Tax=Eruca vesicaria subsp. sativa TaxID=29727 RepID=A0ABC8K0V0_ERUVS|nr:unnamed protein product [Eruca vesicaria subsp. sativa]
MPPTTQPHIAPINEGENTVLKLNLKLGGAVTRTIKTNSKAGIYTKATDEGRKLFGNKVKGSVPVQRCVQKTMYLGEIHHGAASMTEKSRRILKKRVWDPEQDSDDDDGDEEIRYLEKLKSTRVITREYQGGSKEDDREQLTSDKHGLTERSKLRMGTVDSLAFPTTRTRALQYGKDPYSPLGSGPLEFPDALPCPSSKRQKQKLSEVEQQSKKAEAAQTR